MAFSSDSGILRPKEAAFANPYGMVAAYLGNLYDKQDERARQATADARAAAADARAQEQLNMQKAEHQMKMDAVADAKEKEKAMQALAAGVAKPRELSASGSMFAQVDADPKAFDERMKSLQLTEAEQIYTNGKTDQATKDKMLADGTINPYQLEAKVGKLTELAQIAQNPTAGQLETRTQQIERNIKEMAQKGLPITTAVYQELDKARLADEAAKTAKEKQLDEMLKDTKKDQIEALKYGATAQDKVNNSRHGTVDDDGNVRISGNGSGNKAFNEYITANGKKLDHYDAGLLAINEAINKGATADSKGNVRFKKTDSVDEIASVQASAVKVYNALQAKGVDGVTAGKLVAGDIDKLAGKDNPWYMLWGRTEPEKVNVEGDIVNNLLKSAEAQKALQAQKMSGLTQGADSNGHSIAAGIGAQLARQAEVDVASIKAQKALLNMTPEERQFATTKSRLDTLLKPVVEAERGSASGKEYLTTKDGKTAVNMPTNMQKEMDFANSYLMIPRKVRTRDGRELVVKYGDDDRAAILSQGVSESKLDIKATGDKGTAHGIFQWRLDRADALRKFAGEQDISKIPEEKQYDFFTNEMASRSPVDKRYGSMLEEFQAIEGAKNKAEYLSKHYEVAKGTSTLEGEAKVRGELADALLKKYQESQAGLTNDALSRSIEAGRDIKEFNVRTNKANNTTTATAHNTIMRPTISLYDRMTYDPLAPTGTSNIDAPTARKLSSDISTLVKDDINNSLVNRAAKATAEFFGKNDSVDNFESRTLARVHGLLRNAGVDTSNPKELLDAANALDSESKKPVIALAHDKLLREDAEYRKYYDKQQLNDAASMVGRTVIDAAGGAVLEKVLGGYLARRAATKAAEDIAEKMTKSAARNAKRSTKTEDVIEVGSNQLTPQKQKAIDDYINAYIDKFGKGPSTEEIRTLFGL